MPDDTTCDVGGHVDGHGTRMTGKAALVTGAGSAGDFLGTGAATALLLAAQGATVGILDISAERAEHTRKRIEGSGGRAIALTADITDEESARTAVDEFAVRAGRLDVVVNNAGSTGEGDVMRTSREGWDRVFALNVTAAMQVARAAHPHLVRGGGSVINISSIAALRGFGSGAYGASKGALQSLTTDLAYSWGPDRIRVNCLVPGHLHTPVGDHGGAEGRRMRGAANLLGLEGTAWDLAWAVLFLAGAESRWITGTVIPVDAGTTMATVLGMLPRMGEAQGT
jgi:NAD(P)-dependent dehydrogenase (short-subunit alcohol dehydrogenase family)